VFDERYRLSSDRYLPPIIAEHQLVKSAGHGAVGMTGPASLLSQSCRLPDEPSYRTHELRGGIYFATLLVLG
jgi:hypothetical protein